MSTILKCDQVSHWFGPNKVLFNVNLTLEAGDIVGLVGPSGCGKSTLLRAIVGTHIANSGTVSTYYDGEERVVECPDRQRGIVYQKYTLMPFLRARENVALGPKLAFSSFASRCNPFWWLKVRPKQLQEAEELLKKLKLDHALRFFPYEMSGGMQQRVAIAQSLIMKPKILLLDEPFGALDEAMRAKLNKMLLGFQQENLLAKSQGLPPPYTILIVTHELKEALYVGNRVIGLSQHWDWKSQGHSSCPGATIVYNSPCPIYHPDDPIEKHNLYDHLCNIKKSLGG